MSAETLTFTTQQFVSLLVTLIGAIAGATFWITYKVRGIEKDVEHISDNPYLKAFRELEEKHAKALAENFGKTLNIWEDEKKGANKEGIDK
ncbi:MAG TPA: hypothetical protein VGE97_05475 [Nitrososphaera sp.]